MHLWDRDHYVLEDIHSHCADFTSRIVFGRLTENAFNLVEGSSLASFLYRFDEGVGHSVAVPNGHVEGSLRSSRVLGPNEVYSKTAQELHNVSDVEVGTVTVSAWFQRSHDALVLKGANACAEDCVATIGIEIGELRLVLEEIRKRISAK
ncbi:hypothetical protein GCM10007418_09490 [Halopseudomonas salina]|uniref:Uncharacterized protein n=2 Tax=Halopseudomonas salina TaxID=1323744 RepID=A0ABQ1P661_9GAMM|nr:hypothetical protein GCM10007418_09490 [Halopseudomonas salina]